jgi:S1-C subfamily serine protease
MTAAARSRALLLVLLALAMLSLGCPTTFADIDASSMSAAEKASLKLYAAEGAWVEAKTVAADALSELALVGIQVSPTQAARILAAREAGNLALSQARLALGRGDIGAAGAFASGLRSLQAATRTLQGETGGLR